MFFKYPQSFMKSPSLIFFCILICFFFVSLNILFIVLFYLIILISEVLGEMLFLLNFSYEAFFYSVFVDLDFKLNLLECNLWISCSPTTSCSLPENLHWLLLRVRGCYQPGITSVCIEVSNEWVSDFPSCKWQTINSHIAAVILGHGR